MFTPYSEEGLLDLFLCRWNFAGIIFDIQICHSCRLTLRVTLMLECWRLGPPLQRKVGHLSSALTQQHASSTKQNSLQLHRNKRNPHVAGQLPSSWHSQTKLKCAICIWKQKRNPRIPFPHTGTHLQQLTALLHPTLFSWRASSHRAHKDPSLVSSHYCDIIGQTGSSGLWWGGGTWRGGAVGRWAPERQQRWTAMHKDGMVCLVDKKTIHIQS